MVSLQQVKCKLTRNIYRLPLPVGWVERGPLYGCVVAAVLVATDPVERHAGLRFHRAEPAQPPTLIIVQEERWSGAGVATSARLYVALSSLPGVTTTDICLWEIYSDSGIGEDLARPTLPMV